MCGRFFLPGETDFDLVGEWPESWHKELAQQLLLQFEQHRNYDVRPTQSAPILTQTDSRPAVEVMRWGWERDWARGTLFNARAEKITGRAWGRGFRERRAVIPCAGFYEWTGPKGKRVPHAIVRADRRVMGLAGIWDEHSEHGRCFTIITTEANEFMKPLHDRMPVILVAADWPRYLNEADAALLKPWAHEDLNEFPCDPPSHDRPPEDKRGGQ